MQNTRSRTETGPRPAARGLQTRALLAALLLASTAAACGGDTPLGARGLPDVIGVFDGEWELIRIQFGPPDTSTVKTCAGVIALDSTDAEFFFGDFTLAPDSTAGCIEIVGDVQGKVFENGSIQIVTLNPDEIEVFIGCSADVFGNAFGGSQRNDNLFLVRDDVFGSCPSGLEQYVIIFEGQR